MKGPTAWLVSRKDGQDERYIQLELPVVDPDVYTFTSLYTHPTAMQSTGIEAVEYRFDIDKLPGNLVLWEDLSVEEKKFLVHQK
jgi:hypothetical protein